MLDSGSNGLISSPGRCYCFMFLARHFTVTLPPLHRWVLAKPGEKGRWGITLHVLASDPGVQGGSQLGKERALEEDI